MLKHEICNPGSVQFAQWKGPQIVSILNSESLDILYWTVKAIWYLVAPDTIILNTLLEKCQKIWHTSRVQVYIMILWLQIILYRRVIWFKTVI